MTARITTVLLLIALSGCSVLQPQPTEIPPWFPPTNERGDPLFAVFEGRVPCSNSDPDGCQTIKVALVLYRDSQTGTVTTYELARVYVGATPEGGRQEVEGAVTISRGTALDPNAIVFELDTSAPPDFQAYWVVDENILFILDQERKPRVGTASWSFALSRTH